MYGEDVNVCTVVRMGMFVEVRMRCVYGEYGDVCGGKDGDVCVVWKEMCIHRMVW